MPRYSARWANGAWKVFDHAKFDDVATRATQRDAEEAASKLNASDHGAPPAQAPVTFHPKRSGLAPLHHQPGGKFF